MSRTRFDRTCTTICRVYIWELLDLETLDREIDDGYVTRRHHEDYPFVILNYTPRAAYDNHWNGITLACRGLIYNVETGEILARPFEKFFNYDQLDPDVVEVVAHHPIEVTEKVDGSLGIMYETPDGPAIATRGSFHSDQAKHATSWLRQNAPDFASVEGVTYLFEIIYPENRIVVDYGRTDELVMLDAIFNETGWSLGTRFFRADWPGRVVEVFAFENLAAVLAADQISNHEGFVVRSLVNNLRVKIKFDEYKRLHRILTNVTARTVWQTFALSQMHEFGYDDPSIERVVGCPINQVMPFEELVGNVPDEFYTWVHKVYDRLQNELFTLAVDTRTEYELITAHAVDESRAEFARAAKNATHPGLIFAMLDGKRITDRLISMIKPGHELPFASDAEDA